MTLPKCCTGMYVFCYPKAHNSTNRPELWQDNVFSLRFSYASNSNVAKTAAVPQSFCMDGEVSFLSERLTGNTYLPT